MTNPIKQNLRTYVKVYFARTKGILQTRKYTSSICLCVCLGVYLSIPKHWKQNLLKINKKKYEYLRRKLNRGNKCTQKCKWPINILKMFNIYY